MKKFISSVILLAVYTITIAQTQTFTGKIKFVGPGITVFANEFTITIHPDKAVLVRMHYNSRSTSTLEKSEDFSTVDFKGTLTGVLQNTEVIAKGWIDFEHINGNEIDNAQRYIVFTGKLNEKQLDCLVTFYKKIEDIKTDGVFPFIAISSDEQKPELIFPLGKSPKIFNKGWTLGTRFIIKGKNGKDIDLSNKIKWTGTGTFSPSTGKEVHPVFTTTGKNKIILTVVYENKKYQAQYVAEVVNALDYARVGSMADCPADAHSCPGCPHHVRGPVTTGNIRVLIEGKPAACVGDRGTHEAYFDVKASSAYSGCCGPNSFIIAEGDPDVLIEGKPVAKLGSVTQHCGGMGKIFLLRVSASR